MNTVLKTIWVPVAMAATVTFTFIGCFEEFNLWAFLYSSVMLAIHFYTTHFITLKYYRLHNPDTGGYWNAISISSIPVIASFWAGYFYVPDPEGDLLDFSSFEFPVLGLLAGSILFMLLVKRKMKFDLDVVLALLFIMA